MEKKRAGCIVTSAGGLRTNSSFMKNPTTWSDAMKWARVERKASREANTYSTTKCLGCDTISYLTETWFSQETEPDGQPIVKAKRYPPSMARRHPEWFTNVLSLPPNIREFLQEIYVALQNGSLRLCALGTRALIEQIIVTKVGDRGDSGPISKSF